MNYKDRLKISTPVFSEMVKNQNFMAQAVITGGAAGELAVANILNGDELVGVIAQSSINQVTVAGAVAGDITVTGIATTDRLVSVINLTDGVDLTSEFTISAADTINNTGGTATDTDRVMVTYENPAGDLTSEFTVTKDGKINNTGGTVTTGLKLAVSWIQWEVR